MATGDSVVKLWDTTGEGKGLVEVWDLESAERCAEFRGHDRFLSDLAFSLDGRALCSRDLSPVLRGWSVVPSR